MPKGKRIRSAALQSELKRHQPLGQVIHDASQRKVYVDKSSQHKQRKQARQSNNETTADDSLLLDAKTSQRILEMSREQQQEVEMAERSKQLQQSQKHKKKHNDSDDDDDDESTSDNDDQWDHEETDFVDRNNGYVTVTDESLLTPENEALVQSMMEQPSERKTLADMILEKIEQKQQAAANDITQDDHDDNAMVDLPPKVVHVYTEIGKLLSRYTSGKLPKAFKVIPALTNWEEVLYLTRPDLWTPPAMYAATRIFASNLNPHMAQRFYQLVLLDAVREDIRAHKKLNYHYYMALKKAVYKPAAFLKGIVLALCRDSSCTLREAAIVASVLQRVSLPVHHAAVAIHKLAVVANNNNNNNNGTTMYTSGATSIFLRTLLNKKYSLPAPVIGSLVTHFASFVQTSTVLPVLWHQSLLVFVQRYKLVLQENAASREALRLVMKKHYHAKITPEIRRELFGGVAAWKEDQQQKMGRNSSNSNGDDTTGMEL